MADELNAEEKKITEQVFVNSSTLNTTFPTKPFTATYRTNNFVQRGISYLHVLDTTQDPAKWIPAECDASGRLEVASIAAGIEAQQKVYTGAAWVNQAGNGSGHAACYVVSALPAGTNNIGDVDIVSALPAGTNNIGDVDIASALPAGTNNIGDVDIASALPAGTNNIGDVDIVSYPSIPTGTNSIGKISECTQTNLYAYDGAAWKNLLTESNTVYNLRAGIWEGTRQAAVIQPSTDGVGDTTPGMVSPSFLYGYNTATWDRLRSDTTYGLDVDITRIPNFPAFASAANSGVNIAATNTTALAANASRKYALFVNDSDVVIYLKLGATATVGGCIRLNALGGSYEINQLNRYTGIVDAIHGGVGNKVLIVVEG